MASFLSNLVDNLAEGIDRFKCKDCNYFLEYESANYNIINHKCLPLNKNYSKND